MSVSTIDHISYLPGDRTTPVEPPVGAQDASAADEARVRALSADQELRPDPASRTRIAALLYEITGWETFAYAVLAASETPEEAEEHRQILRRRRPPWADED